jgi:hypothetical protein
MLDASASPLIVLLAESGAGAVEMDLSCVPQLFERLGHTALPPQFIALLSEPLSDENRQELTRLVAGSMRRGCDEAGLIQHVTSPDFFFRRLLRLSQGCGHFMAETTEEGKAGILERLIVGSFFDEPLITVVAATRRKAELLAECCQRRVPASCAVAGRHAESIVRGRMLAEDVLVNQLPEPIVRRAVICCDPSGAAAMFEGLRRKSSVLVVYDVPVPALLVGELERRAADESAVVVVLATSRTAEARDVERVSDSVHWIRAPL